MDKEEFILSIERNVKEILEDYLFNNYKKQIMAWRLSQTFEKTYNEAYLWTRCLCLSSNSGILLIDSENKKLALQGLKESAEIYEYFSQISEYYDKEYVRLLAAICYDIAGYQANALCLTRDIVDYSFSSGDDRVNVTSDNYVLQHVKQILLKNIVKARTIIRTDLDIDLGLRIFNSFISKWYENILNGTNTDFLSALQSSYQYYLNTSNIPISHLLFLLKVRLNLYLERSIWTNLWGIEEIRDNPIWKKYIRLLTQDNYTNNRFKDINKRISKFELWASQLRAIEKGLLESDDNFVIQMPTSAGKTFIAEMSILNHLVKNPGKKCIYIAPFRALSNEKELELGNYISKLGYSVSALSGSYELDEFQQIILDDTDVLVATPEKVDLLFRVNPSYFEEVSLIVVDEGQIVGDISSRASLTEFLIISLKMKIPDLKILLVSAVMPSENANEYSLWISNSESNVIRSLLYPDSPSDEQWEPTRKLIGRFYWDGDNGRIEYKNVQREEESTKITRNAFIPYIIKSKQFADKYPDKNNKAQTSASLGFELSKSGNCLIFCAQVQDTKRVGEALLNIIEILEETGEEIPTYFTSNVESESYFFSTKWYGTDSYITRCLKKGIGVHYGDMPEPVRRAVESDYSLGNLRLLISTSTVGQGLNFPIKNLIVHSTIIGYEGHAIKISVRDFWNIIGRAGRAGQETEGQIIFVVKSPTDYQSYLKLTDKSKIEPANSMFFNVLDALIEERIDQPTYNKYMQILSEPYLLSLLVEETLETEDVEIVERIIDNSLFKIQVIKNKKDLQLIKNSFDDIIASIRDNVPDKELVKVYGTTGFDLSSNQAIDQYIETNKEQFTIIVEEDNYIKLTEFILKLADNASIETIEESKKLKNIGLAPSEYFELIQSWIGGQEIESLQAKWYEISDDINKLNIFISDGLYYRYTWAFTAFITILAYKLGINWDDLPINIKNLPGYIKFGVDDPTACLARSLGIKNRDIAFLLSSKSDGLSGRAFIKWLANLTSEDLVTFEINQYDIRNIMDVAVKINPHKFIETPQTYIFNVKGIPYEEERIETSRIVEQGYYLSCRRDLENIYDPYAIKLFYQDRELGFIPREYSRIIATEIDLNNVEYDIVVRRIEPTLDYQNIEITMSAK